MPEFLYQNKLYYNPVEFAMAVLGTLENANSMEIKRRLYCYGELKACLPRITDKMLSSQLKALEEEGFIHLRYLQWCRPGWTIPSPRVDVLHCRDSSY